MRLTFGLVLLLFGFQIVLGDGPADNVDDKVRPIPPKGLPLPEAEKKALEEGLSELGKEIERVKTVLKANPKLLELLPDVQIYFNAVHYALKYDEFLNVKNLESEIKAAKSHLKAGMDRAKSLAEGKAPWTTATGNIVRGYVSKIDGSVQPYGLVVPGTYQPNYPHQYRLDIWCHGRGETLNEISFLQQRSTSAGEFTPANAFVLHPYGRYCNANKFAGEIDVLEAMEHVRKHYPIDENRIVMRGFSMGGAACWQFAVHYPSLFCAAAPGAGFSETPRFLNVFQNEDVSNIPDWEKKLWRLYDCDGYCINLFNLPTVAYSGEIDKQKQAADVMEEALDKVGIKLTHIIGPKTGHSYEVNAKKEINRRIDALAQRGKPLVPEQVKFATYTLRYNQSYWVRINGLQQHWERAEIQAEIVGKDKFTAKTKNVTRFSVQFPPGGNPFAGRIIFSFDDDVNGTYLQAKPQSDGSLTASFERRIVDGKTFWTEIVKPQESQLKKVHGLQGPIDDAFMSRFIIVRPTGKPMHTKTGEWVERELNHAIKHWRLQFRGEAIVKNDSEITPEEIQSSNLILFGDLESNSVLKKIHTQLPLKWSDKELSFGAGPFDATSHMPAMIYPNPLNPSKYVVLNSGFTFREYDYLNNARQVPKLPDFAVIDLSKPINSRRPGGIVEAGFFDENWKVKK
jgi:hypothetical protein